MKISKNIKGLGAFMKNCLIILMSSFLFLSLNSLAFSETNPPEMNENYEFHSDPCFCVRPTCQRYYSSKNQLSKIQMHYDGSLCDWAGAWQASTEEEWITIESVDTHNIYFSLHRNDTSSVRTGDITIDFSNHYCSINYQVTQFFNCEYFSKLDINGQILNPESTYQDGFRLLKDHFNNKIYMAEDVYATKNEINDVISNLNDIRYGGLNNWRLSTVNELDHLECFYADDICQLNRLYWAKDRDTFYAPDHRLSCLYKQDELNCIANPSTDVCLLAIRAICDINDTSQIEIISPAVNQTLLKDEKYEITWHSSNISGNVQIDLYKGGTESENMYLQLAASAENNGDYPFEPLGFFEGGNDYYIGISAEGGEVWDFSGPFTIPPFKAKLSGKLGAADVANGEIVQYRISIENPTNSPITGLQIENPIPSGTSYVSASGSFKYDSQLKQVLWEIGTLTPKEIKYLDLSLLIDASPGYQIINEITIASDNYPSIPISLVKDVTENAIDTELLEFEDSQISTPSMKPMDFGILEIYPPEEGTFYPDLPTYIISHGWNPSGKTELPQWQKDMGDKIKAQKNVNVLMWNWQVHANTNRLANHKLQLLTGAPFDKVDESGKNLAKAIISRTTNYYKKNIHLIGHSLGSGVIMKAAEYIQDFNPIYFKNITNLTLLDSPFHYEFIEYERFLLKNQSNLFVDSYFSAVGKPYLAADVNIFLLNSDFGCWNEWNSPHGLSYWWYNSSIENFQNPQLLCDLDFPPYQVKYGFYWSDNRESEETLYVHMPGTDNWILVSGGDIINTLAGKLEDAGNLVNGLYIDARGIIKDKKEELIQSAKNVAADIKILAGNTFDKASDIAKFTVNKFGHSEWIKYSVKGIPYKTLLLSHHSDATVTSQINIPDTANSMRFSFEVPYAEKGGVLEVLINDVLVYYLISDDHIFDGWQHSDWIDVSIFSGQTVTLAFRLSNTQEDSQGDIFLDDILFAEIKSSRDTDRDGIVDSTENFMCTDFDDADTDNDGILDGQEDINQNGIVELGETDPCHSDTDQDGIQDGTELGYTLAMVGEDTDLAVFIPDNDPSTTTDPTDPSDSPNWIINDGDPGTSSTGVWDIIFDPTAYRQTALKTQTDGATYTFLSDRTGCQNISLWWNQDPGHYDAVPVEIYDGITLVDTVVVNQQTGGGQWQELGTYFFDHGAVVVVISDSSTHTTCVDAVQTTATDDCHTVSQVLFPGWNLLTPVHQTSVPMTASLWATDMDSHGAEITRVQQWGGTGWQSYSPGAPFGDFAIELGRGYFVFNQAQNPTPWESTGMPVPCPMIYEFSAGWNLMGFPSGIHATALELAEAMNAQQDHVTRIQKWDSSGWQSYTPDAPFGSFDITPGQGYFLYSSQAQTPYTQACDGDGPVCEAYGVPDVWKEFYCYNLAAIGKVTGADPFTPSWELIGGYWQWGRKGPDPSQWYDTNTPNFAHSPTGPNMDDANSSEITEWDQTDAPDGAWSDSTKTANDPCPEGFRVPTINQWQGVIDNNTQSKVGTWSESATNYSSARFFGNDLMLPAAGYRNIVSGALITRGSTGVYWGSAEIGSVAPSCMYFSSGFTYMDYGNARDGNSVRCVSE